jgi:hypothetical protein
LGRRQGQDAGVVPADVEDLGEHLPGSSQGVEGSGAKRDGGDEIEVHTIGWRLRGLKDELRVRGEGEAGLGYRIE